MLRIQTLMSNERKTVSNFILIRCDWFVRWDSKTFSDYTKDNLSANCWLKVSNLCWFMVIFVYKSSDRGYFLNTHTRESIQLTLHVCHQCREESLIKKKFYLLKTTHEPGILFVWCFVWWMERSAVASGRILPILLTAFRIKNQFLKPFV